MSNENTLYQDRVEWLGANHANQSGKSDKFYEVTVAQVGERFVELRRWGRYGAKGQTKTLTHYSEYSATQSAKAQIEKKRAKGYTRPVDALSRLASVMDDD